MDICYIKWQMMKYKKEEFLLNIQVLKVILFFAMIFVFYSYMFIYLINFDKKIHYFSLVVITVLMGIIGLILEFKTAQYIKIKKSFWFLLLFFVYLIVNTVITYSEYTKIVVYLIICFIIGSFISVNLSNIKNIFMLDEKVKKVFIFCFFIYVFLVGILLILTFIISLSNIRDDFYLITNTGNFYQMAGYFLSIIFLVYSFLMVFLFSIEEKMSKIQSFWIFSTYVIFSVLAVFLVQLIGSNTGLINILGLLLANLTFYILINLKINNTLKNIEINFKVLFFSKLTKKILFSIIISIVIILCLFLIVTYMFNLELYKFRIFGLGEVGINSIGEKEFIHNPLVTTSVTSRIDLFDNFIIHFSSNPIFGNMYIDYLTTGPGTYVHSFPFSIISHLGIVGFTLFSLYVIFAVKEMFNNTNSNKYFENLWKFYSIMVFSGFLLIATVGTFFVYIVIWFLMGMIFLPIDLKRKE